MRWLALNTNSTHVYKGMAILMIVLHNFMHLFPKPKENEFSFNAANTHDFWYLLINDPENCIRTIFSFLGHFGVQVFVFISAYGLTRKFLKGEPLYGLFLWQRLTKIYPAFLLAILLWLVASGWIVHWHGILGPLKVLYWNWEGLLLKVTFLSGFFRETALSPVGPWWFIPFIFQFYAVFPLVFAIFSRWGHLGLLLVSIVSMLLMWSTGGQIYTVNFYFTVLGHLPVICFGVFLAGKKDSDVKLPLGLVLLCVVLFVLGNVYHVLWYLTHMSFLIILLYLFNGVVVLLKSESLLKQLLVYFGVISMPLFLVSGFLREPFISWAMAHDHWLFTLVMALLSLVVSVAAAELLRAMEKALTTRLDLRTPRSFLCDARVKLRQFCKTG